MVEVTVYDLQDWVMKGTAASSLCFLLTLLLGSLTLGEASSNAIGHSDSLMEKTHISVQGIRASYQ